MLKTMFSFPGLCADVHLLPVDQGCQNWFRLLGSLDCALLLLHGKIEINYGTLWTKLKGPLWCFWCPSIVASVSDPYWSQYGSGSSISSHFRSIRIQIRIRIRIQDFSWPKCKKFFFWKLKILFLVTHRCKNIDGGLPGSSKNHQTFCIMVIALCNLKS